MINRKDLIKLEQQIRFGLCEGECADLQKVRDCSGECPLNKILLYLVALLDVVSASVPVFKAMAGDSGDEYLHQLLRVAKGLVEKFSEEDEAFRKQVTEFFRDAYKEATGVDLDDDDDDDEIRISEIMIPYRLFLYLSRLGMIDGAKIIIPGVMTEDYEVMPLDRPDTHVIISFYEEEKGKRRSPEIRIKIGGYDFEKTMEDRIALKGGDTK